MKIVPHSYISCLGVSMTANNYAVTKVHVTLGVGNYCANDLVDVNWDYSSTVICLGQSRGGPSDFGTYGRLPKGSFATVASRDWYEACIDGNNLQPTYYQTSYTGTGSGPIAGSSNVGEGRDTTPEETFR